MSKLGSSSGCCVYQFRHGRVMVGMGRLELPLSSPRTRRPGRWATCRKLERITRIGLVSADWQPAARPLSYTRMKWWPV